MHKSFLSITTALAALPLSAGAFAQEGNAGDKASKKAASTSGDTIVKMSVGLDYSEGKYGDPISTKVTAVPVSLRVTKGNFTFRVSTSYVHISGPGSLLTTPEDNIGRQASSGPSNSGSGNTSGGGSNSGSGSSGSGGSSNSGSGSSGSGGSGNSGSGSSGSGGGSGSSGGGSGSGGSGSGGASAASGGTATTAISSGTVIPGGANRTDSGIGDTNVSLTYSFDFGNDLYLDVTGKVKIPTASKTKRLGSGEIDFVAAAELSKSFGDFDIYAGGRRRFMGKPTGSTLRDTWGISTGAGYRVAPGVRVGVDYDWQQASFVGGRASQELTGSVNIKLNKKMNLNLYATAGLNSSSVGTGAGAQISYRF